MFIFCLCGMDSVSFAQPDEQKVLIYSDTFDHSLDTTMWVPEIQAMPGSVVDVKNGKLVLDTKGGVTVWLNKELSGDFEITFTRKVVMDGGVNDRLSDVNQFWLARDPSNKNLFTRSGKFEDYDNLDLFYVGMGGNSNTTTRFRIYHNGTRKILHEYKDADHLLEAGHEYHIRIVVKNTITQFFVDNKLYFKSENVDASRGGYFGFRSTASHQEIDNFRAYRIAR